MTQTDDALGPDRICTWPSCGCTARNQCQGLVFHYSALEPADPLDDPRVKALHIALHQIASMKPHHAGQTPNEYHMQQIAHAALAAFDKGGKDE